MHDDMLSVRRMERTPFTTPFSGSTAKTHLAPQGGLPYERGGDARHLA